MAAIIYFLCAFTAALCACLLLLAYRRGRYRLLLWSGLCFAGLTVNNAILVLDKDHISGNRSFGAAHLDRAAVDDDLAVRSDLGGGMNPMSEASSVLMGAVAMASFVATVFFLRFCGRPATAYSCCSPLHSVSMR